MKIIYQNLRPVLGLRATCLSRDHCGLRERISAKSLERWKTCLASTSIKFPWSEYFYSQEWRKTQTQPTKQTNKNKTNNKANETTTTTQLLAGRCYNNKRAHGSTIFQCHQCILVEDHSEAFRGWIFSKCNNLNHAVLNKHNQKTNEQNVFNRKPKSWVLAGPLS